MDIVVMDRAGDHLWSTAVPDMTLIVPIYDSDG